MTEERGGDQKWWGMGFESLAIGRCDRGAYVAASKGAGVSFADNPCGRAGCQIARMAK